MDAVESRGSCPFSSGAGVIPKAALPAPQAIASSGQARRIPGPRGRRLLGSLLEVRRDRLSFVMRSVADFGDIVGFHMGPKRLYLLNHPDHFRHVLCDNPQNYVKGIGLVEAKPLLGEGLLTADGSSAADQRRRLGPVFHGDRLKQFSREMTRAAESMLERWRRIGAGHRIDVAHEMVVMTLDVLGSTLLGTDLAGRADQVTADLTVVTRWAMDRMTAMVPLPPVLPTPSNLRARRSIRRLQALAQEMIDARKGGPRGDDDQLLVPLLAAESGLAASRIRQEILTFLLAGHETTAAALAWTWHLLSLHPEHERRLHEEVDEVLAGRQPTVDDLPRLTYTRAIFEEVLRLYPPVWLIPRRTVHDDEIDGYRIPARSDVLLSVYSMHRHPEYWPDPETFDPERFAAPAGKRPSSAYLPFGAGSRTCLGSRFGAMEAVLVLAAVARKYRLERVAGQRVEAEASLTLRPRKGIEMRLVARR